MKPDHDCGSRWCDQCENAFGPNRAAAILREEKRAEFYAQLAASQAVVTRQVERIQAEGAV